jgi:hypothetical protein
MRPTTQELLATLKNAPLLDQVGRPHTLRHRSIGSWSEALKMCDSETWNALQLMTKNRTAGVVNRLNWHRCQEWNPVCAALRPETERIIGTCFQRISETNNVTAELRNSMSWDLLIILLEQEFDDVTAPFFYIPVLLPIYLAGHLPCGWTGVKLDTDWSSGSAPLPEGEVLIY